MLCFAILLQCGSVAAFGQKRVIVHQPTAELKLQGLLRRMPLSLAHYSIELHPGWLITETYDSLTMLSTVVCSDPHDSLDIFLRSASHPADGKHLKFNDWNTLKDHLRAGYGDRKIGTKVILDTTIKGVNEANGVNAVYELLANLSDRLEFVAMVVTNTETIFVSADFPSDEYKTRTDYYQSIVAGIREQE